MSGSVNKDRTTQLADDLVTALNAQTFSQDVNASRYLLPMFQLEELTTLKVSVIPRGRNKQLMSRSSNQLIHNIEIGIQQRMDDVNDSTETDPIGLLVEEIEDYLLGLEVNGATCTEVMNVLADDSIFAKEHIQSNKVWTTVIVASFQEVR
jgi:hypothetical protein